ncbi:hypothetical protein [Enterobacter hormaechei]
MTSSKREQASKKKDWMDCYRVQKIDCKAIPQLLSEIVDTFV